MIISVINHSNGQLSDETVQAAVRAINRRGIRYQRFVAPRRD